MALSPDDTEYIDANVLVIGGGFAGTWAALRAAELTTDVYLLEKAFVSRSGASVMSGGVTTCPRDGDDLDVWAKEFIERGAYLNHQAWAKKLLLGQRARVKDLDAWGAPITREPNGEIRRLVSRGMVNVRAMQFLPKPSMQILRQQALARGVSILDRVYITDLLTEDGQWPTAAGVVGAVGFNVRDGHFVVIRAKRTILCTGPLNVKAAIAPIDNDTGDGLAMAYRVGAKLTDLEFLFAGTFSIGEKRYRIVSYNVAVAHGAWLINARGERFMERYDPVRFERGELPLVVAAFAKELMEGRGPVFVDYRHCEPKFWDAITDMGHRASVLLTDIPDPRVHPMLIEAAWGIQSGDGRGGIEIDISCHTTVPGLLAAGACAKCGAIGTHGSAGAPTAFAMTSGWYAGDTAARESLEQKIPDLAAVNVDRLRAAVFEPLGRPKSASTPLSLHARIAQFEEKITETLALNADRLRERIAATEAIQWDCSVTQAADLHQLMTLNEARNLVQCCEVLYLSALERTESREGFYREDFPYTNDDEWFCWHRVFRTSGGPKFERRYLPFDETDIQPVKLPRRLSPIAAVMQGSYDFASYDHLLRPVESGPELIADFVSDSSSAGGKSADRYTDPPAERA